MGVVESTEDRRLAPPVGIDLERDLAIPQRLIAGEVHAGRAAASEFALEPELLELVSKVRERRRGGTAGHLAEHRVIAKLRGERVFPGLVTRAEAVHVGSVAALLQEAKFLVNQAEYPVGVALKLGEESEILGHFRPFSGAEPTSEVGLDQSAEVGDRAAGSEILHASKEVGTAGLPFVLDPTDHVVDIVNSAAGSDRGGSGPHRKVSSPLIGGVQGTGVSDAGAFTNREGRSRRLSKSNGKPMSSEESVLNRPFVGRLREPTSDP